MVKGSWDLSSFVCFYRSLRRGRSESWIGVGVREVRGLGEFEKGETFSGEV